jgi:hypothetical protein
MSIYATLWHLKFPRYGDDHTGCEWVDVISQGVPGHIGTPTPGHGYEDGDPYADFLPPPIAIDPDDEMPPLRAVVLVIAGTKKGTHRSPQEYLSPLLVLTGDEYKTMLFEELHDRLCSALRGDQPRIVAEFLRPDGTTTIHFEDGTSEYIEENET